MIFAASDDVARVLIELGLVVSALALLARAASRVALSPIPLYLLGGLALGEGGFVQLNLSEDFIRIGGDIGVVLLLLALGLEYSPDDLQTGLRAGWRSGVVDACTSPAEVGYRSRIAHRNIGSGVGEHFSSAGVNDGIASPMSSHTYRG